MAFAVFHAAPSSHFYDMKSSSLCGFFMDAPFGHVCGVSIYFDNKTSHLSAVKIAPDFLVQEPCVRFLLVTKRVTGDVWAMERVCAQGVGLGTAGRDAGNSLLVGGRKVGCGQISLNT